MCAAIYSALANYSSTIYSFVILMQLKLNNSKDEYSSILNISLVSLFK